MEDKIIMNSVLTSVKNGCDLLLHGSIEANTPKVKKQFEAALQEYLTTQGDIFTEMESAGLYNIENTTETKISKVRSKHQESL